MRKTIFLLCILPLVAFTAVHKYYVALTEIEYNEKQQSVQMIMNVFMDDIEVALNKEFNIDTQISNSSEIKNIDNYFYQYLQKHFKVKIDSKEQNYKFIGKEYDGDLVFFYLEINDVAKVSSIEIKNTVLISDFSDHQNLLKATIYGQRKSLFLTKKNDKGLLNF